MWTIESIAAVAGGGLAAVVLLVVFILFIVFGFRENKRAWGEPVFAFGMAGGTFVMLLIVVGSLVWGMYPWKAEYHQWRPVAGTVQTVDKRMVTEDDKLSEKIVVKLDNGQQYGVIDTRGASLRPGDYVSLACVKRWQYGGTDAYDCKFKGVEVN